MQQHTSGSAALLLHALLLRPTAGVISPQMTLLAYQGLWCAPLWKHPEVGARLGVAVLAGLCHWAVL